MFVCWSPWCHHNGCFTLAGGTCKPAAPIYTLCALSLLTVATCELCGRNQNVSYKCVCARNYLPCKGGCICGFTSLNSKHTSFTLATELGVFTAFMTNPMQSPWRLAILASYPGLLTPAFFTCSTNVGEGLVKQKDVPLLHTSRYVIARDSVLPGLPPR